MRTRALILTTALVLAFPAAAHAELTDKDRVDILKVIELFVDAVTQGNSDAAAVLLSPNFPEKRRVELLKKIGDFRGSSVSYRLSGGPSDIAETTGGKASISMGQNLNVQRGGSKLNVNGISASFTFEKIEQDGGSPAWKIVDTDADNYFTMGAVFKLVGMIFGGCCLVILIPGGILLFVLLRKRSAKAKAAEAS